MESCASFSLYFTKPTLCHHGMGTQKHRHWIPFPWACDLVNVSLNLYMELMSKTFTESLGSQRNPRQNCIFMNFIVLIDLCFNIYSLALALLFPLRHFKTNKQMHTLHIASKQNWCGSNHHIVIQTGLCFLCTTRHLTPAYIQFIFWDDVQSLRKSDVMATPLTTKAAGCVKLTSKCQPAQWSVFQL